MAAMSILRNDGPPRVIPCIWSPHPSARAEIIVWLLLLAKAKPYPGAAVLHVPPWVYARIRSPHFDRRAEDIVRVFHLSQPEILAILTIRFIRDTLPPWVTSSIQTPHLTWRTPNLWTSVAAEPEDTTRKAAFHAFGRWRCGCWYSNGKGR